MGDKPIWLTPEEIEEYKRLTNSQEPKEDASGNPYGWDSTSGAIGNGLSIVGGLAKILNNANQASQTVHPVGVDARIDNLNSIGANSQMSNQDIINGYRNVGIGTDTSGYDFRGMTTRDKIGNIGSSTLSGATTGLAVGGPWGALAGAVIGAGASTVGVLTGDLKANVDRMAAQTDAAIAANNATNNLQAGTDRQMKNNGLYANRAAEGGKITTAAKKKNMSVLDFAKKVKAQSRVNKFAEEGPEGDEIYGGEIAPAVVTPGNMTVLLQTFPVSKDYMISHSALRDAYKDPNKPIDEPVMSISKGVDKTYNLLTNNCSDYTGRFLEDAYGIPMTGGITTPGSIRKKVNDNLSNFIVEEGPSDFEGGYSQALEMPWYNYRVARDNYYQRAFDDRVKELSKTYGLSDTQLDAMRQRWNEQFPKLQWYLDANGNVIRKENSFAEGGKENTISGMKEYSTHGATFTPPGFVHIGAGGTHEQNQYGGVPVGLDPNGTPNLVEEGENIYNDYVMSARLKPTKTELKNHNLPEKYHGKTFAEISDILIEEAETRPNDPISNAGAGAMLDRLVACHEEHKQKLEMKRAEEEMAQMYELGMLGEQNVYGPGGGLARSAGRVAKNAVRTLVGKISKPTGRAIKKAATALVDLPERYEAIEEGVNKTIELSKKADDAKEVMLTRQKEYDELLKKKKADPSSVAQSKIDELRESLIEADKAALSSRASSIARDTKAVATGVGDFLPIPFGPYRNRIPYNEAVNAAQAEYEKASEALSKLRKEGAAASEIKAAEDAADNAFAELNKAAGFYNKWIKNGKWGKAIITGGGAGYLLHDYIDDRKTQAAAESLGHAPVEEEVETYWSAEDEDNEYAKGGTLPTAMRYAPVGDAAFKSVLTALQSPDRTVENGYRQIADNLPYGQVSYAPALVGYRYDPVDQQMVANQINANAAASRRGAVNAGAGPSTGALLVAMNDSVGNAIGTNAYTAAQANSTARNQIAQEINNRELQNANGLTQAQSVNIQNLMNRAQIAANLRSLALKAYDDEITARASALTENTNNLAQGLGNIGKENFYMKQINGDTSKYWAYDPRTGYPVYVGPRKESACGGLLKKYK